MILVLSGTEEGREIVRILHKEGMPVLTTVATDYGKKMFESIGLNDLCIQGRLDENGFYRLILEKKFNTVVDATHPYAVEVSNNALNACKKTGTRHLRFERKGINIPDHPLIYKVTTMEDAVKTAEKLGKNIFLSTGISGVAPFIPFKDYKELYVRILPIPEHIESCKNMGIHPGNIIAMHGPFSEELNRAMFRQYHIDTLVTKESGGAGGIQEKIKAALGLGVDIILVMRPQLNFPVIYTSIDGIVDDLTRWYHSDNVSPAKV